MSSNYPPGHPTGTTRGTDQESVWECDSCMTYWTYSELTPSDQIRARHADVESKIRPYCPRCPGMTLQRSFCDTCDNVATHLDLDRATNCVIAYCPDHSMGGR